MRNSKAFVNGELLTTKNSYTRENPATLEPLEEVSLCSKDDVLTACNFAKQAFENWSQTSGSIRGSLLFQISQKIKVKLNDLALVNTEETGKPINESTIVELGGVARTFEYYAGLASKIQGNSQNLTDKLLSMTLKEPIGVVGQILPWNFPLLLASWKLAPALAAGCTVVLKPSELTPQGTIELAKIFSECGVPDGVVNICPGSGDEAGDALVKSSEVSKISFKITQKCAWPCPKLKSKVRIPSPAPVKPPNFNFFKLLLDTYLISQIKFT